MNFLILLLLIQVSGIVTSAVVSFCSSARQSRAVTRKLFRQYLADKTGRNDWVIDYFNEHPDSSLKLVFPDQYKIARMIRRYRKPGLRTVKE